MQRPGKPLSACALHGLDVNRPTFLLCWWLTTCLGWFINESTQSLAVGSRLVLLQASADMPDMHLILPWVDLLASMDDLLSSV